MARLLEGKTGFERLLGKACRPGEGHVFAAMWRVKKRKRSLTTEPTMGEERPVRMTAREQDMLAGLIVLMRDVTYDVRRDAPISGSDLVDQAGGWVLRFDVKPQELDAIYGKVRR